MFEVEKVAKRIREARIQKNMTQNRLADELGVSYQAVSNWERGNSMSDISKYEDLCRILDVNLEFLLGFGSDTNTVNKMINSEKHEAEGISIKDLIAIAPMMSPDELKTKVEECTEKENIDINSVIAMAPFLSQSTLDRMAERAACGSMDQLIALTPFLSSSTLSNLIEVWNITKDINMNMLFALAPFLDTDVLDRLAAYTVPSNMEELAGIAPFLSSNTLTNFYRQLDKSNGISVGSAMSVLPFINREGLELIANDIRVENAGEMEMLIPWFSREMLERIWRNSASRK